MAAEIKKEIQLEIAHVLFIDVVGYSNLSINDQHAAVEELNRIVRASEQFQRAEAASRLLKERAAVHRSGNAGPMILRHAATVASSLTEPSQSR
jgi:hypothetical protein